MRVFAALAAICAVSQIALAQTALAQTPDCKSMADADARLACYDNKATSAVKPGARPLACRPGQAQLSTSGVPRGGLLPRPTIATTSVSEPTGRLRRTANRSKPV